MREILFKAKTLDDKPRWVEGYYSKTVLYGAEGYEEHIPVISDEDYYWYKINPETLGQFTGIKDKNDVKIFEGDIVRADNGHTGYVIFRYGSFVKECSCHYKTNKLYGDNETVIGNIYDNPELLEEESK